MKRFIFCLIFLISTISVFAQDWKIISTASGCRTSVLINRRAETTTFINGTYSGATFSDDLSYRGDNKASMAVWWQFEPATQVADFRVYRNGAELCRYSIKNARVFMMEYPDGVLSYVIKHEGDVALIMADASQEPADIRINKAMLNIHNRL